MIDVIYAKWQKGKPPTPLSSINADSEHPSLDSHAGSRDHTRNSKGHSAQPGRIPRSGTREGLRPQKGASGREEQELVDDLHMPELSDGGSESNSNSTALTFDAICTISRVNPFLRTIAWLETYHAKSQLAIDLYDNEGIGSNWGSWAWSTNRSCTRCTFSAACA